MVIKYELDIQKFHEKYSSVIMILREVFTGTKKILEPNLGLVDKILTAFAEIEENVNVFVSQLLEDTSRVLNRVLLAMEAIDQIYTSVTFIRDSIFTKNVKEQFKRSMSETFSENLEITEKTINNFVNFVSTINKSVSESIIRDDPDMLISNKESFYAYTNRSFRKSLIPLIKFYVRELPEARVKLHNTIESAKNRSISVDLPNPTTDTFRFTKFGLFPVTKYMPYTELLQRFPGARTSRKIEIRRCAKSGIEYTLIPFLDKMYIAEKGIRFDTTSGLRSEVIQNTRTIIDHGINTVNSSPSLKHIIGSGSDNYVIEFMNEQTARLLGSTLGSYTVSDKVMNRVLEGTGPRMTKYNSFTEKYIVPETRIGIIIEEHDNMLRAKRNFSDFTLVFKTLFNEYFLDVIENRQIRDPMEIRKDFMLALPAISQNGLEKILKVQNRPVECIFSFIRKENKLKVEFKRIFDKQFSTIVNWPGVNETRMLLDVFGRIIDKTLDFMSIPPSIWAELFLTIKEYFIIPSS